MARINRKSSNPDRPHHFLLDDEERDWILAMRAAKKCASKVQYETEDSARIQQLRQELGGQRMSVYRCKVCSFWHLSSKVDWKPS